MGGRGNLNTLRKLFNWNSTWYNKSSYKQLLFRDLVLDVYLTSLFYKLRIASSYFLIKNSFFSIYIIECDLYLTQRKKLLSLFFNYKEFIVLMRLCYSFFKKYGVLKVKKRSKSNRSLLLNNKTHFFGAAFYYRRSILSTLCNYYLFLYNMRNMLFLDTLYDDLDNTTKYSLNVFSKQAVVGYIYASYSIRMSKRGIASITNSGMRYHIRLPEPFYFIKYVTLLNSFSLVGLSTTIRSTNLLFLSSLLGTKENTLYNNFSLNIRKAISTVRSTNKDPFFRYRVLFHIVTKLNTFLSKKVSLSSHVFIELLHSKIQQLGTVINRFVTFQTNIQFLQSSTVRYSSIILSFAQSCQTADNTFIAEQILFLYYSSIFSWLSTKIEHTLISYTGSNYLFRPNVYLNYKPFITNSKILGEYISLSLSGGDTVNNVFKSIQQWIEGQQLFLAYRGTTDFKTRVLNSSYLPLKGVRIICKGPTSIARRKRKVTFHTWVSNNNITGKMPAQSLDVQVDFYQTFAVMPQASVGIKVWTLFEFIENC